jgi:hypothetical protein
MHQNIFGEKFKTALHAVIRRQRVKVHVCIWFTGSDVELIHNLQHYLSIFVPLVSDETKINKTDDVWCCSLVANWSEWIWLFSLITIYLLS